MEDVYTTCPTLENDAFLLRFVTKDDSKDLLEVYGDKNALPFFNSDNCHGDNFYYNTREKMDKAIDFWLYSYKERFFVRWAIIDKNTSKAIGTIELFHRDSDDELDGVGVLRLDVKSEYEKSDCLYKILDVIVPPAYELFDCREIISKVPMYAVERADAFEKYGFSKTDRLLIGSNDNYGYNCYWAIEKK